MTAMCPSDPPAAKACFRCNIVKPLTDFYAHPMMADGRLGKCKECARADVKARYALTITERHAYEAKRNATPERKARLQAAHKRHNADNPDKALARHLVAKAIRSGKLARLPCEVCGAPESQGHHEDYSKPLDVRWLCFTHHREAHGQRPSSKHVAGKRRPAKEAA